MTETRRRDQWEPPSATAALRASLIGRNMWVVLEKSGRASLRVRGSGVCINMNAMEGRSRTICDEGYCESCSRSKYLDAKSAKCDVGKLCAVLFPECYSLKLSVYASITEVDAYIIRKPIIF